MKHIKLFKTFESGVPKPIKRYPTEPAAHYNYIYKIVEEAGLDPNHLKKGDRSASLHDFFFDKCSGDNIVFPNIIDSKGWKKIYPKEREDSRYKNFIFGESVFLIPETYDPSSDSVDYEKKKKSFYDNMKDFAKQMGKSKSEEEKFMKDLEKNVHFGAKGYDWINPALKDIHDKLGQYYKNGKLRVWMPKDRDYDPWEGVDHPHKYNIVGDLDRPNGVYYLSDIEKYIDDKYGISDDLLYQFVIHNQYIEGRYWERVWSFPTEDALGKGGSRNKLQKSGFGQYGMEPTENILHILNIIEKEFEGEIESSDYEGFPVYVDYLKKVEDKY